MNRRVLKVAGWLLAALLVAGVLLPVTVRTRSRMSCAVCRAERMDQTLFGISWETFRDTEFAAWYRAHRPAHEHRWGHEGCTVGLSLVGTPTYFACYLRHPVCDIPQSPLLEYCQTADDSGLTAYFDGITSDDREVQEQAAQRVLNTMFPPDKLSRMQKCGGRHTIDH